MQATTSETVRTTVPDDERVADEGRRAARELASAVGEQRKILSRLEKGAKALSGTWKDPKAVEKAADGLEAASGGAAPGVRDRAMALSRSAREWIALERAGRLQRLARGLEEGCAKRGIEMQLVSKEPLEIRLAPLGVEIDVEKGKARVVFGKVVVAECPARADEILDARRKALDVLEGGSWTAEGFHAALVDAWRVLAARSGDPGGWVELSDVLPLVAVAMQDAKWRRDPTARNFRSYGKAQFLWDLGRLRSAGGMSMGGRRLVVGVATGDTTRDKRRVFWLDDGRGRGAYHLTLKFVREERIHAREGETHV